MIAGICALGGVVIGFVLTEAVKEIKFRREMKTFKYDVQYWSKKRQRH